MLKDTFKKSSKNWPSPEAIFLVSSNIYFYEYLALSFGAFCLHFVNQLLKKENNDLTLLHIIIIIVSFTLQVCCFLSNGSLKRP